MSYEELIEKLSDELTPAEAHNNFTVLLKVLGNVADNPSEPKFRSVSKSKLEEKLSRKAIDLLRAVGFADADKDHIALPKGASLDSLQSAREMLQCLALSYEPSPQNDAAEPMDTDDADLAAAMELSLAQKPDEQRDREMAERLEKEAEEHKAVDFERFQAEDVVIDDDAVDKINEYCRASGQQYVDPQFPPTDRSIYRDEADATTWQCSVCHARTPLPPVPPIPKSREEAEALDAEWKIKGVCSSCRAPAPHVATVRYFQRPTQWLRPGVRCIGCEMIYSHLPSGKELVCRMCPHFIRDTSTATTVGAPWKLIREEARAEDVCQGGLGNCWLAAALSIVARFPELIDKMFVTKEFNEWGAYHLRLCHAGEWRSILVDDLLPTSKIFEGYMDGMTAYYSQGGSLCYLHGARRQIWVPIVEKAAAKLYGCWANMMGGTIAEAMSLFTGFPTQRIRGLYIRKAERQRREEQRQKRIEQRTQLLLQGQDAPEDDEDSDEDNDAMTWSKILSASEAGYVMGMGCTEEACEKTKDHLVEQKGLQAPHAYGILDAREVQVDGKLVRLLKIRNPWGEKSPRTWKGDWGKDSSTWTFELQLELGVVNRSGVKMDEDMGIFWMAFEDVKEYFSQVEVCRVHQHWKEIRCRGWLPSALGPGEAFDLTVFRRTQVDIVVWQEKHITREAALGARSTNVDLGLAVLRKRGIDANGQVEYELVEYIERSNFDDSSAEMILEGGFVYRLVPISYGLLQEVSPRRCVLAVHSVQVVELQKSQSSWHEIASGAFEGCRKRGRKRPVMTYNGGPEPGLQQFVRFEEGCGCSIAVENTSSSMAALQFDASDCEGCSFSRGTSVSVVAVPPMSRQIVMGIATNPAATRYAIAFMTVSMGAENAAFAAFGDTLHTPLPLLSAECRAGSRPPPDESILKRAPPEVEEPSPKRRVSQPIQTRVQTEEEMLAEALALSMGVLPGAVNNDDADEDDLAAAIRLSMAVQPESTGTAMPAPGTAAPPTAERPKTAEQKKQLQDKVKALFEELRRSGMPPNEAAQKALAEARRLGF
jgi:calpain-15